MSSGYGKVERSTWEDDGFRRLSPIQPSAQGLWLFLLSCPLAVVPVPGLIRGGRAAIAEILHWPLADFDRCWSELAEAGMAVADWTSRVVWLPKAVCFNPPDNPKHAIGWARAVANLPAGPIREQIVLDLSAALRAQYPACLESFQEAWSKLTGSDFLRGSAVRRRKGFETVSDTVSDTVSHTQPEPNRFQGAGSREQGAGSKEQGRGVCPELASSSEPAPVVLTFPVVGKAREWHLRQDQLEKWSALFPGLDVLASCRKALAWVDARPRRRKTFVGMEGYLATWLTKDFEDMKGEQRRTTAASTAAEYRPSGAWKGLGQAMSDLAALLDAATASGVDVRDLLRPFANATSLEEVAALRAQVEERMAEPLTHPLAKLCALPGEVAS